MKELIEKWRNEAYKSLQRQKELALGTYKGVNCTREVATTATYNQCANELEEAMMPRPIEDAKLGRYHWCRRKGSGQWWMCFVRAKSLKDIRDNTGEVVVMSDGEAYSVKDFDLAVLVPLPMDGGDE